jgi:hypothetical protein
MTELSESGQKLLRGAIAAGGFVRLNSGGLSGGVAQQVRASLINKGLLEEVTHEGQGDLFNGKALKVTEAGYSAVDAEKPATQAVDAGPAPEAATPPAAKAPRAPRENTKTQQLIAKLREPDGATVDELCKVFGWQAHTTRAAISTLPKKDAALKPTSEKVEGRGRVYRLEAA